MFADNLVENMKKELRNKYSGPDELIENYTRLLTLNFIEEFEKNPNMDADGYLHKINNRVAEFHKLLRPI